MFWIIIEKGCVFLYDREDFYGIIFFYILLHFSTLFFIFAAEYLKQIEYVLQTLW